MTIDRNTGLPEAPEGRFWYVEFHPDRTSAYIYLAYEGRSTRRLILDLPRDDWAGIFGGMWTFLTTGGLLSKDKVKPRHIRAAAHGVLRERARSAQINAAAAVVASKYAGAYPPKKLGVTNG